MTLQLYVFQSMTAIYLIRQHLQPHVHAFWAIVLMLGQMQGMDTDL